MKVLLAVLVLISVAVNCKATIVQQCNGRSIENLNEKITIGACKKPPCRLRKNTSIAVEMKFTPESDVDKLQNSVNANILGVPFPFVGVDGSNACDNIFTGDGKNKVDCPLKGGQEYLYKNKIDVLQIYPRVKIVVHWGLQSSNGEVVCFEVPARITN